MDEITPSGNIPEADGAGEESSGKCCLLRRTPTIVGKVLLGIIMALFSLWCIGVIIYLFPVIPSITGVLCLLLLAGCAACFIIGKWRLVAVSAACMVYILALIVWFSTKPSNDKHWQAPWALMPQVVFNGNDVTVNNVRDFIYRSENDYTPHYINKKFDLGKARDLRVIMSFWDGNTLICHMMLDFGFDDGKHLVVSIETRLPVGVKQSTIGGMFKQYEVLAIAGTQRDLIMLRTNYRKEQVYMYQTTSSPDEVRSLLVDIFNGMNKLRENPVFYNTITTNCTTSLIPYIRKIRPRKGWSIKFLLNGLSPEMAFEGGWFKHKPDESFSQYNKRSCITPLMQKCTDRNKYSEYLNREFNKLQQ